jgi:hypothetical protein
MHGIDIEYISNDYDDSLAAYLTKFEDSSYERGQLKAIEIL